MPYCKWCRDPVACFVLVVCGMAMLASPFASAQVSGSPDELVRQVEQAYENLEYDEAESLARNALTSFDLFSPDQLVRIHTTLALVLFVQGEEFESAEQFRSALTLNPDLELDPVLVSPVTLEFFADVKQVFEEDRPAQAGAQGEIRYILVEDNRPGAAMRSLVLPGWGQRHKDQRSKGWLLTGLWAASAAASVYAHVQRNSAQEAYLEETDPSLVQDRYDTYSMWHKIRGGLLIGTAAVWTYAIVDALAVDTRGSATELTLSPSPTGLRLQYRF
ncbi:MAG: hypothetical protein R3284_04450 [Rubricoccaceae bacterium]|nr:hypothetical protein [Rubricoccaceae bacterium]